MSTRLLLCVAATAGLSGCVGTAGIGADGAVTAERESNAVIYERTGVDGSTIKIKYLSAKKGIMEGLDFDHRKDGTTHITLDKVESGDRTVDRTIGAVEDSFAILAPVVEKLAGKKITLNTDRKRQQELRKEKQSELRRQEALQATEEAEAKRLEAERKLLLDQERLRIEAEARAAAELHAAGANHE